MIIVCLKFYEDFTGIGNMYDRRDLSSSPRQVISVPPYKLTCASVYPTCKDKTAQGIDSGSALLEGELNDRS
jgi:hypothetical protein